jgi:L-alanine-DL-glutamate epimerase-like enolase superfamily enzyme
MKITAIEATPLGLPFRLPYHWAGRCDFGAHVVLLEVETDAGIIGIGESTAGSPPDGILAILRSVSGQFIGESPFDVERLLRHAILGQLQSHSMVRQSGAGRARDGAVGRDRPLG